jgi:hypothetical protein
VSPIIDVEGVLSFALENMQSRLMTVSFVFLFLLTAPLIAQWTPPADNKLTEAQLKTYLDTQKDWLDESAKIIQDSSTAKLDQNNGQMVGDIAQRYQVCLDRHHISKLEFEWIGQRAEDAWSAAAYLDGANKTTKDRLDAESAQLDDTIAAAQKQLAIYQDAKDNGLRILTADDRAAAIKSAQEDQRSALEEVKRYTDDATTAEGDAAQHDADAKSSEDQSANPPADVSADDRAEYIQNKKNEAQAARASAIEARVEEADAKKSEAEAQAQADAAAQRAAHPEIPFTDDEKNQAKSDNDAAILVAKNTISAANLQKQRISAEQANLEKTGKAMTKGIPPENIALLRKYEDQYKQQFAEAVGTTQPSR